MCAPYFFVQFLQFYFILKCGGLKRSSLLTSADGTRLTLPSGELRRWWPFILSFFILFINLLLLWSNIRFFFSLPHPQHAHLSFERERNSLQRVFCMCSHIQSPILAAKKKRGTCVCGWIPVMSPFQMIFYFLFYITPGLYSLAIRCV